MAIQEMVRLEIHCQSKQSSMPITDHNEETTCICHACNSIPARKSDVAVDANDFLCFLALPLPSCSKNPIMPHPPRVLQENSKYPRGCKRENNERAPKLNSQKGSL